MAMTVMRFLAMENDSDTIGESLIHTPFAHKPSTHLRRKTQRADQTVKDL